MLVIGSQVQGAEFWGCKSWESQRQLAKTWVELGHSHGSQTRRCSITQSQRVSKFWCHPHPVYNLLGEDDTACSACQHWAVAFLDAPAGESAIGS